MASPYDILIDIRSKTDEVKAAAAELAKVLQTAGAVGGTLANSMGQGQAATNAAAGAIAQLNQGLEATRTRGGGLREMFEQAFAFGIGNQLVEKALEVPTRLVEGLREAAAEGIKFNTFAESTGFGLAGVLKQMDGDRLPNFNAALEESKNLFAEITEGANRLGVSIEGAADAYKTTAGAMFHAGISDLQQQIELTFTLQSAMNALNVPDALRQRDIQDILLGRAHMTKAGRELGLSDEDLKAATDEGKLYEFLMEKLSGYAQAGKAAADTFERSSQRMRNELTLLEASTTQPLFDVLKDGAKQFTAQLASPDFQRGFGVIAQELAGAAKGAIGLGAALVGLTPTLIHAAEYVLALSAAMGVGKLITNLDGVMAGVGALTSRMGALLASFGPAGAILAAATAGFLALRHESEAMEAQTRNLLSLFDTLDARSKALKAEIGLADTPEKKAETYAKLDAEFTKLILRREALRQQGKSADDEELKAIEAKIGLYQTLIATFDRRAGKEAAAAIMRGNSEKAHKEAEGFAKAATDYEQSRLDAQSKATQDQAAAEAALAKARQQWGLEEKATAKDVINIARQKIEALETQGTEKPALIQINQLQEKRNALVREQAELDTKIKADQSIPGYAATGGGSVASSVLFGQVNSQSEADKQRKLEVDRELAQVTADLTDKQRQNADATDAQKKAVTDEWAAQQKNLAVAKLVVETRKQADDSKEAADAERLAGSKRDEANARKDAAAASRLEADAEAARELALQKIRDQLAAVKSDPSLTDAEKVPLEIELLKQEEAQLLANIAARNRYGASQAGNPSSQGAVDRYEKKNENDQRSLGQVGQARDQNAPGAQLKQSYTELLNQTAISSKKIGATLQAGIMTGINAVSQGLTNLIFKTGSWRDVFLSAGQQIVSSLLNQGIEFVAHYALIGAQMLAHFAMSEGLKKAETTSTIANNSAKAASSATAALLESITTYGVAALIGVAAFVAAMALTGGFAEGGLIPGKPSRSDNRLANVATGEYIVRSDAVSHYGAGMFEALNSMQVPRAGYAYASGGLVGGSSAGASLLSGERSSVPNVSLSGSNVNVAVMRDQHALNRWAESKSGRSAIVRIVREEGVNIGIPA